MNFWTYKFGWQFSAFILSSGIVRLLGGKKSLRGKTGRGRKGMADWQTVRIYFRVVVFMQKEKCCKKEQCLEKREKRAMREYEEKHLPPHLQWKLLSVQRMLFLCVCMHSQKACSAFFWFYIYCSCIRAISVLLCATLCRLDFLGFLIT